LRCLIGENLRKCDLILPTAEFTYNSLENRSISMSLFEVVHGYNSRKLIDLILMTQHLRVFESAFALHIHDLHKEIRKKFRKLMPIVSLMLICTEGILNLMKVMM